MLLITSSKQLLNQFFEPVPWLPNSPYPHISNEPLIHLFSTISLLLIQTLGLDVMMSRVSFSRRFLSQLAFTIKLLQVELTMRIGVDLTVPK